MKFFHQVKIVIITVISVLCALLLINLCRKIRFVLPWRVNCWFCNYNVWVKFYQRNCWTCPKCEQYNGFTKDGDYNKQLFTTTTDQPVRSPKVFKRSPPKNGLCKMCNINQQLKVAQLANFVAMNDRNYDNEIEAYRLQLEKAYKLCTPCKRVLNIKLHKEKETLLGSKLLNARTPEKKFRKKEKQTEIIDNGIYYLSILIASLLFILVSIDLGKVIMNDENLSRTVINIKVIIRSLSERIISIAKMKIAATFPSYESNLYKLTYFDPDFLPKMSINYANFISDDNIELGQEILVGLACLLQILGQFNNINKQNFAFVTDLLLTVFIITCVVPHVIIVDPVIISLIKFTCIAIHLLKYKSLGVKKTNKHNPLITQSPLKKMKNLARTRSIVADETESSALDTDDDVSLSKFGLHNFTDSSNETSPINKSLNSGRMFMPRTQDSIWTKPQMNSTFCVNSVVCKSPSSVSDTVFIKPSFNKYQKLVRDDSDSELDESIGSLCIGSPLKAKQKSNSIFSLKKFSATPSFIAPRTTNGGRPLISPSALGHSASWVAGGYWGSEGERQIFNINGSRSSSQSSGFESQASSLNQRNAVSQPPSREDSDCGESDRAALLLDRFQHCNMSNYGYGLSQAQPLSYSRVSSPIYPQLQCNGHVHIPQTRLTHSNGFGFAKQQHYVQNSMFKAPASSGIIKLPQASTFSSR